MILPNFCYVIYILMKLIKLILKQIVKKNFINQKQQDQVNDIS